MKFPSIRRSVRANRHDRAPGDAPNLGRLVKMPGTGIPRRLRWHRTLGGARGERSAEAASIFSRSWTMLLVAMVVISLGVTLWLWVSPKMAAGTSAEVLATVQNGTVEPPKDRVPSPSEQDATALVKRAVAARDPATVESLFRTGSASPEEVVKFLETMKSADGPIDEFCWLSSLDVNRLTVDGVAVRFNESNGLRNRVALLTPDAAGEWKIDFDAFARTVKPNWRDFFGKPFETAVVRVFFVKDNYFNGPFSDENEWMCLTLKSPDREEAFFGYCKKGSPQAAAIDWIFSKKGLKPSRVTLELRRMEGAAPLQFEISRVLAEDWILTDVPFDEGFR
ncbi:MAG: hypothetical protein ACRCXD_17230 [Luteolibacter sp.]